MHPLLRPSVAHSLFAPQDNEFNVDYFKSFDFVMNALDNLGQPLAPLSPLPRALISRHRPPPQTPAGT